ncbi:Mrp/NBP35 family ATP-binding protein [Archaeoglobus veneficus]|uniref:Iron-sulfur cluster carrier protein n=1 Tax=Archaeoglobus veneficus (strain DSM 11195 / SNP6) TaxID=693661 RepID=F2KPS9_ARCVS|nr:Mrp/NBP35 family ATP-binding protein [Archaeoglobus veneficus]AEA47607.1 ATPase-like, ParA/MinD [Archaeoglobus veneficus SNP6]
MAELKTDDEIEETIKRKMAHIKRKIAVMSGKGGVGKSTVTALLAVHLAKQGKLVGILDADFLGPSIPKLFGLERKKPLSSIDGIEPILSPKYAIRIMSMQFVTPEAAAVIWRGPMISRVLQDFLAHVSWGNLDYLIIDMPPGTGDVPITVMQEVPLDGVVMVATPHDLTANIVERAINMARTMDAEVLGIVENMSYYRCPDCGRIARFGNSAALLARKYGLKIIASIPLEEDLARYGDAGVIEEYKTDYFEGIEL